MRAYERKSILMIANLPKRDLPTLHRVATLAVGTKLAAMDVSMTIGACLAHVLEDKTRMALRAANLLMHATQRIPGVVVVEFRIGTDRLPTCVGVAILARGR